jgi:hypothetical protein
MVLLNNMDLCLVLLTTLFNFGDVVKIGFELFYLVNYDPSIIYIQIQLCLTILMLILKIVYDQMNTELYIQFFKTKLLIIISLLILTIGEIIIILLINYTISIYYNLIYNLCLFLSFIVNFMYIKTYVQSSDCKVSPLTTNVRLHTYEISPHICKENCDECPCVICMENIDVVVKLPCNHFIHHSCYIKWRDQQKNTCPLCRSIV